MSLLIVGLDNTIVNVALPSIGRELWIITGCGLAVLVLGFASTTEWANASARHVAEELRRSEEAQPQQAEPLRA